MKQSDWKIIYTNYSGVAKKAINFLSKEAGAYIIREPNVYRIHVLPCEKEGCAISKNTFFVSLYDESSEIQKHVSRDEIPEDGFLVKVIGNPDAPDGRLVILTAHSDVELFYAAVSFIDDYIPKYAPKHGANTMADFIFDSPLTECSYTERPDYNTRSIFTWGHSINDYRAYIDNMARLKFNELILWNDYVPLNIKDIIDYAHAYGIRVNLGYSWGWIAGCKKITDISDKRLLELKESIIAEYEKNYRATECDGIYFQSFTERNDEYIGGRLIAEGVTTLVNMVSGELLRKYPDLKLQFGLHASSVNKRLDEISKVDPRVEILWEDCGAFPYNYISYVDSEERYNETLEFTKKLLELRGGVGVGLVFKGVMMLDWTKFVHQVGPYVMGENSGVVAAHDRRIRSKAWRKYSSDWIQSGEWALKMFNFIKDNKKSDVSVCLAGTFDGGIYLPMALCAQMFRNCSENYGTILAKAMNRPIVNVD